MELGTRFGELPQAALQKLARFITREHRKRSTDPTRLIDGASPCA